jgi:hypothetical protein
MSKGGLESTRAHTLPYEIPHGASECKATRRTAIPFKEIDHVFVSDLFLFYLDFALATLKYTAQISFL